MSRRKTAILEPGKPRYASKNRGLALLDEAIEQIKLQVQADKGQWHQNEWRCGSGMCLAGWVGQLAGGEWAYGAEGVNSSLMIAVPEDRPDELMTWGGGPITVHVADRAERLLSPIWEEECDELFEGHNTLERIEELRDEIAERLTDA